MRNSISILLVEDEAILAMAMKLELRAAGYHVAEVVSRGEDAVAFAAESSPGVVVMDISLAGEMDGIEAAHLIRLNADVPVIFTTGYDDPQIKARALAEHPLEFLNKPVDRHRLHGLIDSIASKT